MVDIDEAKEAVMGGEQHDQSKGPQNQAKGSGWYFFQGQYKD